jgi:septal ring factor EnvC (AmiA/AmiB activator)
MNRVFYSLPDPREVGLKWKQFEKARQKVERIEKGLHDTQNERARLEQEVRELGENEVRELARAILEGTDDPSAKHGEHEKLVERLRTLKREEQAIAQALPVAEEELRQTVFEYQHKWKDEADSA